MHIYWHCHRLVSVVRVGGHLFEGKNNAFIEQTCCIDQCNHLNIKCLYSDVDLVILEICEGFVQNRSQGLNTILARNRCLEVESLNDVRHDSELLSLAVCEPLLAGHNQCKKLDQNSYNIVEGFELACS